MSETEMIHQASVKSLETHPDVGRAVAAPKATGWMVLAVACVLTAMVSIATTMWLLRDGTGGTNGVQQLVFIDAKRLIEAKALELNARRLPDSEHTAEGAKFADLLQSIVVDYQSKGYTVVNGGVLLSETDQNDLTDQVAKQMGIRLDIKELADASAGTR